MLQLLLAQSDSRLSVGIVNISTVASANRSRNVQAVVEAAWYDLEAAWHDYSCADADQYPRPDHDRHNESDYE
ncbi:MAG TPA: hypothetical protein VGJ20_30475 [Xanthobacteraceae bacterium]|jgi:hypothetical protein